MSKNYLMNEYKQIIFCLYIMSESKIYGEYISLTKLDIAALQEIWGEEKDN